MLLNSCVVNYIGDCLSMISNQSILLQRFNLPYLMILICAALPVCLACKNQQLLKAYANQWEAKELTEMLEDMTFKINIYCWHPVLKALHSVQVKCSWSSAVIQTEDAHTYSQRWEEVKCSGTLIHCYFQRCLWKKSEDGHMSNIYLKAVKARYPQMTEK